MSMMRIGYDAKRAFCNGTGLGNYSRMLIHSLSNHVQTVLYTPRMQESWAHYFDDCPNIEVRTPKGCWQVLKGLWRTFAIGGLLKHDGIDLYHGLSHELPHGIPRKVRRVVTMHDLIVRRYPHYFTLPDRLIHRLKQRHACRTADLVVAISEQTKSDLVSLMQVPEEKIRVVYQSCDPIFLRWNGDVKRVDAVKQKYDLPERYIICVGTLEERKNQLSIIKAMEQLPDDLSLVLVGRPRGSYGQLVTAQAHGRIHLLKGASFTDFPALYAGAVASVYMSRFEGFGIPVLESLCCDTPVVTSNCSSMPEAGGEAALYAAPDDIDAIAQQLLRLATDEALRQQQIAKGRLQRQRFAPERVTESLLAVYNELLHQ